MDEWLDGGEWQPEEPAGPERVDSLSRDIDPIATTDHLRTAFLRYLKTLHPLRSSDFRRVYWQEIERPQAIVKGPLLEGAPPFRPGRSICCCARRTPPFSTATRAVTGVS
jgi:hypothetical protein